MTSVKKRSKSFTGCFTCRSRKIRCDLTKPFCLKCEKSNIRCAGYDIKLRWSSPIRFNKFGQQLPHDKSNNSNNNNANSKENGEFFQRRNIDFVKYPKDCVYETYEDIDQHLSTLNNSNELIEDNVKLLGPFGVFKPLPKECKKRSAPPKLNRVNKKSKVESKAIPAASAEMNEKENNKITLNKGKESITESDTQVDEIQLPTDSIFASKIFGSLPSFKGHEWLSSELKDDALLTAAARNGDTQFLNYSFNNSNLNSLNNVNNNADFLNEDEFLNLIFGKNSNSIFKPLNESGQILNKPNPSNKPSQASMGIFTGLSQYSYNYNYNENLEIHLHGSEQTKMPNSVMEIISTSPLDLDLSIDNFGVPTTALQVLPLTRYLLNYYIENVADLMTVIPLTENPWKTIYFPRALQAIGDLAALGKTSNSKNALLNALLAVSAFNLQSKFEKHSSQMKYYLNLGIQLRQQASVFLKKMIEQPIEQLKYKDSLTAILSMVTIDVVWGTMSDCSHHLKACGNIITKKMITKTKLSPKARILHRVFSSLKLIQDSTSLDPNTINPDEIIDINGKVPNTELIESNIFQEKVKGDSKVRIEFIVNNTITHYSKSNDDSKSEESNDSSPSFVNKKLVNTKKNDENFATDALYGLPNSLIVLFSEIVKLVRLKIYYENKNELPHNFKSISNSLEKKLLGWHLDWKLYKASENIDSPNSNSNATSPKTPVILNYEDYDDNNKQFLSSMHEAIYHHIMSFYHALRIYYYKLIKDLNSLNLQGSVSKTLYHLISIQKLIEKDSTIIIPLFWQGFIAGCEAIDTNLQLGFKKWGADVAQYLGSYWGARQIMFEVWRRKEVNAERDDWVSVIQDWEMNLMLT